MASSNSTEVKIIQRGQYYLTPFTLDHIDEVVENLTQENKRELILLGHNDLHQAMHEMYESSECYLARKEGGKEYTSPSPRDGEAARMPYEGGKKKNKQTP